MQAWSAAVDAPNLIAASGLSTLGTGQKSTEKRPRKPPQAPAGASGATPAAAAAVGATLQADALYPTWLLATPQRLVMQRHRPLYQGPLTLLAGPQRIEAAWWEPDASGTAAAPAALRDYFIARSSQAGLLWIYRERLAQVGAQPGWFLHGLFA